MSLRVLHFSDFHVQRTPRAKELLGKRSLGAVNLYVLGRARHFSRRTQEAFVAAATELAPDAILCSGDLTALGSAAEFEAARDLLAPLLDRQPAVVIPGNHDTYTWRSLRERRFEHWFGRWMGAGDWPRLHRLLPGLDVIAVHDARAHASSAGRIGRLQLERLEHLLTERAWGPGRAVLMLHYPIRSRLGDPYGPRTRALSDAASLEKVLARHPGTLRAVLHGHEHHGYEGWLNLGDEVLPIFNPGASGYSFLPHLDRTAHFCFYDIGPETIEVRRFHYDGQSFVPEPGGAWSSGR